MKEKFKTLLVLLGMLIPMITTNVYAEEQELDTTKDSEVEAKVSIKDLQKQLPDQITVDIKESEAYDMVWFDEEHTRGWYKIDDELAKKSDEIFKTLDKNNDGSFGFVDENNKESNISYLNLELDYENPRIARIYTSKSICENGKCENKEINIKNMNVIYSNSSKYNEEDAKKIQSLLDSVYFTNIRFVNMEQEIKDLSEEEVIQFVKDKMDLENIKIVLLGGGGDIANGLISSTRGFVIYKDDIYYGSDYYGECILPEIIIPTNIADTEEAYMNYALPIVKKHFETTGGYYNEAIESLADGKTKVKQLVKIPSLSDYLNNIGYLKIDSYMNNDIYNVLFDNENVNWLIRLKKENVVKVTDNITIEGNSGVTLSGTKITKEDKIYTDLANVMAKKGYQNVFGAYELKIEEGTIGENGLTLTFNVGEENNRKKAFVLHQKHDGTIEEFTGIVENGKIKVTVSELSPFMVALGDIVEEESTPATNNADTGTTNILLCGVVALSTMGGMVYLKKNKQK